MNRHLFIWIASFALLGACTSNTATSSTAATDPFKDCKAGKPKAIFQGDFEQVSTQTFKIEHKEGIENVQFENGLALELIQLGCDKVTQVFQFTIPQKLEGEQDWMTLAADQFVYLSRTSEQHGMLGMWGQTIRANGPNIQLGEKQVLQPGISIKVDKVQSMESTTLVVELSQD